MCAELSRIFQNQLTMRVHVGQFRDIGIPLHFCENNLNICLEMNHCDWQSQTILTAYPSRVTELEAKHMHQLPTEVCIELTGLRRLMVTCDVNKASTENFQKVMAGNREHIQELHLKDYDSLMMKHVNSEWNFPALKTLVVENHFASRSANKEQAEVEWKTLVELVNKCKNLKTLVIFGLLIGEAEIKPEIKIELLRINVGRSTRVTNVINLLKSRANDLQELHIRMLWSQNIFEHDWYLPKVKYLWLDVWALFVEFEIADIKRHFNDRVFVETFYTGYHQENYA